MATTSVQQLGVTVPTWLADPLAAWVPVVLADVWKTTPFVALLLIAGLKNVDPTSVRSGKHSMVPARGVSSLDVDAPAPGAGPL